MATVDISPIANGIRGFGTGMANLAIKKALLGAQAEKQALAAQLTQSQIDFNDSKAQLNKQKYDALAPLFGRMAGMDMADRDVRNELAMLANGKAYLPYSNVGSTGATFNRATGAVSASPEDNPLLAAELAVRKSQADKNALAAELSQSQIDFNQSKTALNQQKYDALVPLFGQLAGMDLADRDVRNDVAMLANGKAYMPYSNVGSTGATFSRATGDVAASPERTPLLAAELAVRESQVGRNNAAAAASLALKALNDTKTAAGGFAPKSGGSAGSVSNVKSLYTDNVETPDPFMPGVMKVTPRTDYARMRNAMAELVKQGKNPNDMIAHLALMAAGANGGSSAPVPAQAVPAPTVPTAPAASGDNIDMVHGRLGNSGVEAAVNSVLNQLRRGEITRAEAQAALTQLGVN